VTRDGRRQLLSPRIALWLERQSAIVTDCSCFITSACNYWIFILSEFYDAYSRCLTCHKLKGRNLPRPFIASPQRLVPISSYMGPTTRRGPARHRRLTSSTSLPDAPSNRADRWSRHCCRPAPAAAPAAGRRAHARCGPRTVAWRAVSSAAPTRSADPSSALRPVAELRSAPTRP